MEPKLQEDCFLCKSWLLVGSCRIGEFLIKIFQLEYHGFGFIGDMCNEEGKDLVMSETIVLKTSVGSTGALVYSGIGLLLVILARMVIGY